MAPGGTGSRHSGSREAAIRNLERRMPYIDHRTSLSRFRARGLTPAPRNDLFEVYEPGAYALAVSFLRSSFLRSFGSSNILRSRIDFGVTSTNSSSWI